MAFRKTYKIKESYGDIETNEIFLDALAKSKEEEFGFSEKRFEVKIKGKIIYAMFGVFFLLTAILFSKTFYLQIIQGKQLAIASSNNKGKLGLIAPERGIIYDANLTKLVTNAPAYDLVCDKRNFSANNPESVKEIDVMSGIIAVLPDAIKNTMVNAEESKVLIAQNIDQEKLLILEAHIHELPDCQVEKNTVRNYVMGPLFSHVLGYTAKTTKNDLLTSSNYTSSDYIGKVGLEKYYESALRGVPGTLETIKTASGIKKSDKVLSEPQAGNSLVLNIDANLQKVVYDSLEKSIKNVGSKKGAAIALDPRTGAVLAMVSYPAYDDNIFSKGVSQADFSALLGDPSQPFFNRAIAAKYPTGSTIKPFEAAAALQEHIIDPKKLINDPGYIMVKSQNDPSITYTFSGVTPHGLVDMKKAIAVSSNIYFFTVGGGYEDQKGLGPARIKKYLDLFGWENKTGVDLPGEFKGFVPSPEWKKQVKKENWWDGDTYNLSIGQSDLQVTPLQVAVAYAAVANGGTLYKPQIVNKIIDSSGTKPRIVQQFKPEVISQGFIDPQNLEIVREGMRDGVHQEYGSSLMLNDLPVAVAGKTGTVETGKAGIYNTWSADFAPYDKPSIVFLATIEGVQGLRAATLPVAHDVLQWYFSR